MTQTAKNNLVNLSVQRVASVDKAANRRTWLLLKRAQDPPSTAPASPPTPIDPPSSPTGENVNKTAEKPTLEGLTDEQKAYVNRLEKAATDDDDDYRAAIMKMEVAEPVKQQLIKSEERAREGERIAKAERSARRKGEHTALAKSEFSHLSKSADALGGLMMRLEDDLAEADYAEVRTLLKAANAQLTKGSLFVEHGAGGGDAQGSASEQIEKAAVELRKSDPKMSLPQARIQAAQNDPELKARWQEERAV